MSIRIPLITDYDSKGVDKAIKDFQQLEGAGAKAGFAIKKAAVPAAVAVAGLAVALGDSVKAAMEDQASQAQLALSLENVTGATDDQIKAQEKMITKMSLASGVADDELRPALASLVRGTKDIEEANKALALAQDVAAGSGKSLGEVSDALAKAYGGNMKGLQALSPEIKMMIKDGASLDDVMNVLGGTFGGAMATQAATAQGEMKRFSVGIAEAKESIGYALMPVLEAVMKPLMAFSEWAQTHTTTFIILAGVIGGIAVAILAVNAAMKIYQATQVAVNVVTGIFNALLLANPITLIILAVVAFIAVLAALYFKFDSVRKIVDEVFTFMKDGVKAMVNIWIAEVNALYNAFKFVFNGIASLWNNTVGKIKFTLPSWIPGIGGSGFAMPQIPMMANGGIVNSPTLAMIGEAGPEAVVPLGRGGGMGNITVNITGGLDSSAEIGQAVVNAIRAFNRTNGPAQISVA
jgi:hypothetical protein